MFNRFFLPGQKRNRLNYEQRQFKVSDYSVSVDAWDQMGSLEVDDADGNRVLSIEDRGFGMPLQICVNVPDSAGLRWEDQYLRYEMGRWSFSRRPRKMPKAVYDLVKDIMSAYHALDAHHSPRAYKKRERDYVNAVQSNSIHEVEKRFTR